MKSNRILIELTARLLATDEADQVRELVAAMKPRVHLVAANWRWIEARGLTEEKAARLIESLQSLGLRFKVAGQKQRARVDAEAALF